VYGFVILMGPLMCLYCAAFFFLDFVLLGNIHKWKKFHFPKFFLKLIPYEFSVTYQFNDATISYGAGIVFFLLLLLFGAYVTYDIWVICNYTLLRFRLLTTFSLVCFGLTIPSVVVFCIISNKAFPEDKGK
jgi:hypothetical protein